MVSTGFETAISASKRLQIYALDHMIAGISNAKIDKLITILSKLVYSVTFLICIPKPTSSNFGDDTGCCCLGFLCCLQFPTGKF
jgi:hypothetical protein